MDRLFHGSNVASGAFWFDALRILLINILLSGDNAIVIAMACRRLPPRKRLWGMAIGSGSSALFLITLSSVASQLIVLPYLKIAGAVALLYIAVKLLLPEAADETEPQAEAHLWRAVRIVVVADFVMSFDNIIAVAMAAQGNLALVAVGLGCSIPIVVTGAAIAIALFDRFPILVWIGAALLGSVAGEAFVTDPALSSSWIGTFGEHAVRVLVWTADATGGLVVVLAGLLLRRRRQLLRDESRDR